MERLIIKFKCKTKIFVTPKQIPKKAKSQRQTPKWTRLAVPKVLSSWRLSYKSNVLYRKKRANKKRDKQIHFCTSTFWAHQVCICLMPWKIAVLSFQWVWWTRTTLQGVCFPFLGLSCSTKSKLTSSHKFFLLRIIWEKFIHPNRKLLKTTLKKRCSGYQQKANRSSWVSWSVSQTIDSYFLRSMMLVRVYTWKNLFLVVSLSSNFTNPILKWTPSHLYHSSH